MKQIAHPTPAAEKESFLQKDLFERGVNSSVSSERGNLFRQSLKERERIRNSKVIANPRQEKPREANT